MHARPRMFKSKGNCAKRSLFMISFVFGHVTFFCLFFGFLYTCCTCCCKWVHLQTNKQTKKSIGVEVITEVVSVNEMFISPRVTDFLLHFKTTIVTTPSRSNPPSAEIIITICHVLKACGTESKKEEECFAIIRAYCDK